MLDYQIQPNTRRCCVSGRELQPGGALPQRPPGRGRPARAQGLRRGSLAGPTGRFLQLLDGPHPARAGQGRRPVIDDDLLLDCFLHLEGQADPGRVNFRYVLALLLMRRRRLRFEEDGEHRRCPVSAPAPRTGARYQVANPCLTEEEMAAVQEDVFRVLGWE